MKTFEFTRPPDAGAAIATASHSKTAQQGADVRFIAGGTTLIDLMKLNVETPARVLDINRLPLDKIEPMPDGGLKIGATVRNSDLAHHPTIERDYAVLSQAILNGASAQLRNMATTAGNLLQRTRCMYFRDTAMPCNKREPGTGCPAITGTNRMLAILGTSEHCIATNPSDICIAMAALETTIHVQGTNGARAIPIGDFHLLPGSTPNRETVLEPGDLVTHVTLPSPIGRSTPRVDGAMKVSGQAQYTSDFQFSGTLYAVPVEATIASGRIVKLDTSAAGKMPGVRAIFHRENIGKMFRSTLGQGMEGICEERRPPFEDDVVGYYGQYIALAVADTFEAAKAAADAVRVTYSKEKPNVETHLEADNDPDSVVTTFGMRERVDSQRGDADAAFASAPVKLDQTYVTPAETHNPIELHATTAIWEGSKLTLYDSSRSEEHTSELQSRGHLVCRLLLEK